MKSVNELILYRPAAGDLLAQTSLMGSGQMPEQERFRWIGELVRICETYGLEGDPWQCYLAWYLVYHENAYSCSCEMRGAHEGGINAFALHDFAIFRELFVTDPFGVRAFLGGEERPYRCAGDERKIYNRRIRDRICTLARELASSEDDETFKAHMDQFYREYGVGKFGLHKAFRVVSSGNGCEIVPITNTAHVNLEDLVGYEIPKQKLVENTEAFVEGRRANNCLLFGDSGTGKSSSIKAILNRYYDRGLRMIEIYKHQMQDLSAVISDIKNRNYRFIIYMDDLSFEDFEVEYKYLKAVIEGGLEKKPENILIYATSNRRHLIRESFEDKFEGGSEIRQDMHSSDTVQEKLSLVYRFGVTIYFGAPDKKEFQQIVTSLADRFGLETDREELLLAANAWELQHGGLSGRTAQQFIDHVLGTAGS